MDILFPALNSNTSPEPRPLPVYAGFGRRLVALIVDCLLMLPCMASWMLAPSPRASLPLHVASTALLSAYQIAMNARFGQTLGKMVARIRIVKLSGEPISWREALLRSALLLVGAAFSLAIYKLTIEHISDVQWQSGWVLQARSLAAARPAWSRWDERAAKLILCSDVLLVLFNRQKRALHDFIAGTMVVHTGR